MAFAYSIYKKAYAEVGLPCPLKRTGSVSMQLRFANSIGSGLRVIHVRKIGAIATMKSGDLLAMKSGRSSERDIGKFWLGHIGIFARQESGGRLTTIEGNTSSGNRGSQRDGGGVYRRTRSINFWLAGISAQGDEFAP